MTPAALLDAGVDALGLGDQLPAESRVRLMGYLQLLQKWNRTYNLTAIREPERMVSHHLLDSLAILPYGLASPLLDVGSGAGLPGIPLAIARPDLEVTLLDAVEKKCAFLRQAGAQLGLRNVQVVHARVETWRPGTPFQRVVSRAFSDLGELVRLTRHLLATGGQWLAMKGARPDEELAALQGARPVTVHALQVPGLEAQRHLVILEAA